MNRFLLVFSLIIFSNFCFSQTVKLDTITLNDSLRHREIPIAIYSSQPNSKKLVILSHGYNENRPGSYLGYSFLAEDLAREGYIVFSIQHELPSDSLMPMMGVPQIVRRPAWERGVANILFLINSLKSTNPNFDFNNISLIGHSMGGDISMLFAQKYPQLISKIISLDHRRVAIPRMYKPKILSLRSTDQIADENVIPTDKQIYDYGMQIIKTSLKHNEMSDQANEAQRKEMNQIILEFLRAN